MGLVTVSEGSVVKPQMYNRLFGHWSLEIHNLQSYSRWHCYNKTVQIQIVKVCYARMIQLGLVGLATLSEGLAAKPQVYKPA